MELRCIGGTNEKVEDISGATGACEGVSDD